MTKARWAAAGHLVIKEHKFSIQFPHPYIGKWTIIRRNMSGDDGLLNEGKRCDAFYRVAQPCAQPCRLIGSLLCVARHHTDITFNLLQYD